MTKTKASNLATVLKDTLQEYENLAVQDMKVAVTDTAKEVKADIAARAPKRTGAYKKSWTVKKTGENATSISVVVHSKNKYQLAHLLEFGHAKRGGGRTRAYPHIEPAQVACEKTLSDKIERSLKHG